MLEEAECDSTLSKDTLVKDLDPCAVCNVVGEAIVGYIGIIIMVYFAYRTTLVDGELDNITLHANPANMDGDVRVVEKQEAAEEGKANDAKESGVAFVGATGGENMRMIETPLSSYSVRYDSLGLWIKLFTLFANTYIKDTVWFALLMIVIGAILLVLGIKVPAYHDQRGMRLVDPNCLQNGIDAAVLWVYVCGFVGAVVVQSVGRQKVIGLLFYRLARQFLWQPRMFQYTNRNHTRRHSPGV